MPLAACFLTVFAAAQMGPMSMRGGRGGGWSDRAVVGEVTDLNPVKGYIQVRSFPEGVPRIIVTTPETAMTKDAEVSAAELKVGDRVTVRGVPAQLAALVIGVLPAEEEASQEASPPAASDAGEPEEKAGDEQTSETQEPQPAAKEERPAAPSPMGGRMRGMMGGRWQGGGSARPPGEWSATAVVKALDPLAIELEGGQTVTLTVSDATRITRPKPATIEDVKVGAVVGAVGERNDDGYLQAEELFIGSDPRAVFGIVMRQVRRAPRPAEASVEPQAKPEHPAAPTPKASPNKPPEAPAEKTK